MLSPEVRDRINRGDPIPANWLNAIADAVIERLIGGKGVNVVRIGQRVVINIYSTQIVPKT
ncbi:MAG: hypothetical protein IT366_21535 [Candidatus Hydrogenedentes bacterium]|nr:hypothetical protein [Candidatus Hydrogenedentota bacterium]